MLSDKASFAQGPELEALLESETLTRVTGRVRAAVGLGVQAHLPAARRGEWVRILRRHAPALDAEVVGFSGENVMLMPLGDARGVGPDDVVEKVARSFAIRCGPDLAGRVLDGIGRPLDTGPALSGAGWSVHRDAPTPLSRAPIARILPTGVRAIDGLCTVGEGQRLGIFAGSGVGKTSLLSRIATRADSDVIVACLIGERGRELNEFLEALAPETRARCVVVCATSDHPPLVRMKSAYVATAIAEYFRDRGQRVVLLMDSLTRFVRAARDVGLAAGEPPTRRGFPPSAFAELAPLLERAGNTQRGSITGFYTVLVEGGDLDEPVTDEARGLLDGHLVLDRVLAQRGHFPPIDVTRSLSRLMDALVSAPHATAARKLRAWLQHYELKRDLVELGATQRGQDPLLDQALSRLPAIHAYLRQEARAPELFVESVERLIALSS
jgi:ATP synthase in type III secretion protein N